jgi:hypothetical protein
MISAWALHSYPPYLLRSIALTTAVVAVPSALWPAFKLSSGSGVRIIVVNCLKFLVNVVFAESTAVVVNLYVKDLVGGAEDEAHVFRYLASRVTGRQNYGDLEVQLYLCHEAFDVLDDKASAR